MFVPHNDKQGYNWDRLRQFQSPPPAMTVFDSSNTRLLLRVVVAVVGFIVVVVGLVVVAVPVVVKVISLLLT